jgi:hypothetical protein
MKIIVAFRNFANAPENIVYDQTIGSSMPGGDRVFSLHDRFWSPPFLLPSEYREVNHIFLVPRMGLRGAIPPVHHTS